MKLSFIILTTFLFMSCSGSPQTKSAVSENTNAKNRQTAVLNEVSELTRVAQKLEQHGRKMEFYRNNSKAENVSECRTIMEDSQKELKDFEMRINKLPVEYNTRLAAIFADLNVCVSCSPDAMASCVKTRASINKAIEQTYSR